MTSYIIIQSYGQKLAQGETSEISSFFSPPTNRMTHFLGAKMLTRLYPHHFVTPPPPAHP